MPPEEQIEKLVVHNPHLPITLPPREDQTFAIVAINGQQLKVMKDDVVLANWLKEYDINDQIELDGVMLVGTPEFTVVGRPFVASCKVRATVEQQTEAEKTIVFKKKRRKQYQNTMHFRHKITVLRINKVEVDIGTEVIRKAVSLN